MLVFILDSKNIAASKITERSIRSVMPDCTCILVESHYAVHMNRSLAKYDEPFFLVFFAGEQLELSFQNQLDRWISCLTDRDAGISIDAVQHHESNSEALPSRGPILWRTAAVNSGTCPGFPTTALLPFESYVLLDKQYALEGKWDFQIRQSNHLLPKTKSNEGWRKLDLERSVILPILQNKHSDKQPDTSPFITVVICSFNNADYLLWAVRSVCMQSYPAWELMIVDDGSTDGTQEKWESSPFSSYSKIRFFRNEINGGKASCLNQALNAANGNWLLELDSDDWLDTACLQTFVNHIAISPDAGIIYADHAEWYERRDKSLVPSLPQYDQGDMTVDKLLSDALPLAPRMYSIQTIKALGGWSVADPYHGRLYEDLQMLARIMLNRPVSYIPKTLYHRRIRSSSITHLHPDCYKIWHRWMLEFIGLEKSY